MLVALGHHQKKSFKTAPPRSRFVSNEAVIRELTQNGTHNLPGVLNPNLCNKLSLPLDTKLERLARVNTKGVGATQCRPYIMHLSNGVKFFLKLSPKHNQSILRQREADRIIQENIANAQDCPIVFFTHGQNITDLSTNNEMLFFPFVAGDNLFITIDKKQPREVEALQFSKIGETLGIIHIQCMKQANTLEDFLTSDGKLPSVLIHPDWQSTNIMITPENNAIWIDTEGTSVSTDKPYLNIAQTWELCGKEPMLMQSFLQGYLNQFPCEIKNKMSGEILCALEDKHKIDIGLFRERTIPSYK